MEKKVILEKEYYDLWRKSRHLVEDVNVVIEVYKYLKDKA